MKRKVYKFLLMVGVVIVTGTVGSVDIGTISMTQGILQIIGALIVGAVGYIGLLKEENK